MGRPEDSRPGIEPRDGERDLWVSEFILNADTAEQAEERLFAYVDNDYEDDLRGATATAEEETAPGTWTVILAVPGEH